MIPPYPIGARVIVQPASAFTFGAGTVTGHDTAGRSIIKLDDERGNNAPMHCWPDSLRSAEGR